MTPGELPPDALRPDCPAPMRTNAVPIFTTVTWRTQHPIASSIDITQYHLLSSIWLLKPVDGCYDSDAWLPSLQMDRGARVLSLQ